jgi:hypothetical protein
LGGENVVTRTASNGQGGVYQRGSDGLWIGAVTTGYGNRGQAKRKPVSSETRAEAAKKLWKLQHDIDNRIPPSDGRITVFDLYGRWLTEVILQNVAANTAANYTSLVNTHIVPDLGRRRLSNLEPDHIQRFLHTKLSDWLVDTNGWVSQGTSYPGSQLRGAAGIRRS